MKLRNSILSLACVVAFVILCAGCGDKTTAADNGGGTGRPAANQGARPATTAKSKGKSGASTNAAPVEIPKSVFVVPKSQEEGRDPFFPESMHPYEGSGSPTKPVQQVATLVVNGITPPDWAIINGQTFKKGEEQQVTAGGNRIRLRCIEIKPDSVTVEIVGGERRELPWNKP